MSLITIFTIFAAIYLALLFWLNHNNEVAENDQQFSIAGRDVSRYATAASLASSVRDASGIVVWLTFSVLYGLYALIIALGLISGWLLLSFSAKKIHMLSREKGYVTLSDYLQGEIGKHTALMVSWLTIGTAFFLAAAQLNITGEIVSLIYGIPLVLSIIIVTLIVFSYLLFGGYGSVIKTDYLQWVLIILSLIFIIPTLSGSLDTSINLSGMAPLDHGLLWGVAIIAFLSIYPAPDAWQRIFSAKSAEDAKRGLQLGAPFFLAIIFLLVTVGMQMGALFGGLPEGNALYAFFSSESVPNLVLALLAIFVVTSMMSTLDTQAFLFAQTVSRNLLPNKNQQKTTRIILSLLFIVLAVIAFSILDIITFLFSAVGIISIAAPVLLFYNLNPAQAKQNDIILATTLLLGLIVFVYLFTTGALESIVMNLIAPAVSSVTLMAGLLFSKIIPRK